MSVFKVVPALCLSLCAIASAVRADEVVTQNLIVSSDLVCIGRDCEDGEPPIPSREGLKIKTANPAILFEDTTPAGSGATTVDWQIGINDTTAVGNNTFLIQNLQNNTTPFSIDAGAPDNALFISDTGRLGVGTNLPIEEIHVARHSEPAILLDVLGHPNLPRYKLSAHATGFSITNLSGFQTPMKFRPTAPTNSFVVSDIGYIGLGTSLPHAPLHLQRPESFNFFRIEATGAAVNTAVDITFTEGPLGTGQLRYNIVDGDNQEMSLDADGNMVLDGTLTTAGPTCAGGCDRVFDADYALPSISEHAEQMFAAGHLPQIGATLPHAPVNLSERQGGIINSLEHAHIYITELHTRLESEETRNDALETRVTQLERRLEALQ